jgi:hypothetical protein
VSEKPDYVYATAVIDRDMLVIRRLKGGGNSWWPFLKLDGFDPDEAKRIAGLLNEANIEAP